MNGKGDRDRVTNLEQYRKNYERIYGKEEPDNPCNEPDNSNRVISSALQSKETPYADHSARDGSRVKNESN